MLICFTRFSIESFFNSKVLILCICFSCKNLYAIKYHEGPQVLVFEIDKFLLPKIAGHFHQITLIKHEIAVS